MKKDLINTNDWSTEQHRRVIDLAFDMKEERRKNLGKFSSLLKSKTLAINLGAQSTRTQLSFHASIAELGGHSFFIDKSTMHKESLQDLARTLNTYCCAYGVRFPNPGDEILTKDGDKSYWKYGECIEHFNVLKNNMNIPIISLRHDTGHPCQGLYEIMTYLEALKAKDLKGRNILITWTKGKKVKPWSPTLETLRFVSRFGMNVTLCYPEGYELDNDVIDKCKTDAIELGGNFNVSHDFKESFHDQEIVYGRHWSRKDFVLGLVPREDDESKYKLSVTKEEETGVKEKFIKNNEDNWTVTKDLMKLTNDAKFINPGPFEGDLEAMNEIWDDKNVSLQLPLLENKLHIQKAVLALTTGVIKF